MVREGESFTALVSGILDIGFQGQEVMARIQNVIGVIEGAEEPDRYVRIPALSFAFNGLRFLKSDAAKIENLEN